MKDEALEFIEKHKKCRMSEVLGRDMMPLGLPVMDKEYYVDIEVAREAVDIALRKRKGGK